MNRLILLGLASVVLYFAFIGLSDHPQHKLTLVDMLPQETIAVIEGKNIGLAYRKVQQGLLGKVVSRDDFSAFVQRFDLSDDQVRKLTATTSGFHKLANKEKLLALLSHEAIVALLPLESGEQIGLEQLGGRLVFFQYLPSGEDLGSFFSQCFGRIGGQKIIEYQGRMLTRLNFVQGESLTYFTHMGVLVWAFEEKMLYPCINQLLQHLIPIRAGIQKHVAYTQLKKKAGRLLDTFVYIRLPALQSLFGCTPTPASADRFPCPDDLAIFTTTMAKGSRFAMVALADSDKIAAYTQRHHLRNAMENAPLSRLSVNTVFALWTNWFKPGQLWEKIQLVEFSPVRTLVQGLTEEIGNAFHLSLANFFTLFGNEFSLNIDHIHAPNQFPRSLMSASIEIKDRPQVEGLLKRMTRKLQQVEVISNGMRIITLRLADGLLQPAYALTKKYLILADNIDLIERIHEKIIPPEQRVNQVQGLRTQRSNFFLFIRTGDVVEWLFPIMTTIIRELGSNNGENFNEWLIFHPLTLSILSDLKQIETTRVRLYLAKNELFFEMISQPRSTD